MDSLGVVRYLPLFGLNDNPFAPARLGEKGIERKYADNLVTRPLRLDGEPRLMELYVPDAGPFGEHLEEFESLLDEYGYSPMARELGNQSLALMIAGPTGTGKSTLANRMLAHAFACLPESRTVDANRFSGGITDIAELRDLILDSASARGQDEFFPVFVTEVCEPALRVLEEVYNALLETHLVLMVLESESREFVEERKHETSKIGIVPFDTCFLTAPCAEAYVAQRLEQFRDTEVKALFATQKLFPFRDEDVAAVGPQNVNGDRGSLGIREFNFMLSKALRTAAKAAPSEFDIRGLDPEQLREHTIDLADAYVKGLPT